jgi:hypothetical protein
VNFSLLFQRPDGTSPLNYLLRLQAATSTTVGDMLTIGMYLRTEIVDKTARGVDVNGDPFAAYSTRGPYYYNPSGQSAIGTVSHGQQRKAAKRLLTHVGKGNPITSPHLSRTGRTIVFPGGYAQFKQWLGRNNVDLTGPRAPHMMQSIQVRAGGQERGPGYAGSVGPGDLRESADSVTLGIYGEPAARASGHNAGNPRRSLPQRRFLGIDDRMKAYALEIAAARIRARVIGVGT